MATKAELERAVELSTLWIRETLMAYFKGHDEYRQVERGVFGVIDMSEIPEDRREYRYERNDRHMKDKKTIHLDGTAILFMSKAPNTLTFITSRFQRSKPMQLLEKSIREAVDKYLMNVTIENNDTIIQKTVTTNRTDYNRLATVKLTRLYYG